jgi:heme-degrading monooxygenase HmoA
MRKRLFMVSTLSMTLLTLLSGCRYTAPWKPIPGAQTGPDGMALVTFSQVDHRPGQRKAFFTDTKCVLAGMAEQEGLLGYSFRFQIIGKRAWTMTAWRDEAAQEEFVRSPAHREAVKNSRVTSMNVKFVSIKVPAASLPYRWDEAIQLLEKSGNSRSYPTD